MNQIQNIPLLGLTHSPSDNLCQDGELGTCLGLISEDGSLIPIPQPQIVESFTLPEGASIRLVHKVTHDNTIHSHYIILRSDGSWYWTEKGGDGTAHDIPLGSFHVNAVTAVGNILNFVGDQKTLYCYWENDQYKLFDFTNIKYRATVTRTEAKISVDSYVKDNTITEQGYKLSLDDFDSFGFPAKLGENVTTRLFSSQDAYVNMYLDSYSFKYVQFAVLAIQLYDGSYIQIGNPFMLSPKGAVDNKIALRYSTQDGALTIGNLKFTYEADNIYAIYYGQEIDKFELQVFLEDIKSYETIIKGVDVFISNSIFPYNTKGSIDRMSKRGNIPFRSSEGHANLEYSFNNMFSIASCLFYYPPFTKEEMYKEIDNLTFYKSISFSYDDIINGKRKQLKRVLQTEESLPLADTQRASYGAKCAITYNNRLHLANVTSALATNSNNGSTNLTPVNIEKGYYWDYFYREKIKGQYCGNYIDSFPSDGSTDRVALKNCEVVSKVLIKVNNIDRYFYYYESLPYPLDPTLSFPYNQANSIELFIKYDNKYYKKSFELYKSDTFGFNFFVNYEEGSFCPIQVNKIETDEPDWVLTISQDPSWQTITEEEFNNAKKNVNEYIANTTNTTSLVKVSEAENPMVFPAKNSVQVGSSIINALSVNTRPISEGQFGDAPLYAFTDEGVWVLIPSDEGIYIARQPASRDICSNPEAIVQIDDAVLFPTSRGILMQQGRVAQCITDVLDGYPFDFTKLRSLDHSKLVLQNAYILPLDVQYVRFRQFLDNGTSKASIIYDYYDSRIIVFNPDYTYAYVYSLKSQCWGTMSSPFSERVNIYPESYALDDAGHILNIYIQDPKDDVPYFVCTRPFTLSQPDIYKTIFSLILRGYVSTENGKCGLVLYGSNDLHHWYLIKSSVAKYIRGICGSPYKYFRLAIIGSLSPEESLSSLSVEFQPRWQNKLR